MQTKKECIHVVVGVIRNNHNEILVSRRKPNTHLENFLEIPGGKVEQGELPFEALKRELNEELAIQVTKASQLIQIPYQYTKFKLLLDVFVVDEYTGTIESNEGQEVLWKSIDILDDAEFPEANFGILRAIKLPELYPITPSYSADENYFDHFENIVNKNDIKIIQLRSHELDQEEFRLLAKRCAEKCKKHSVKLILNRELKSIKDLEFTGIHLTSKKLQALNKRPLGSEYIIGASCHNTAEVEKANMLKLDYIFIGPVEQKSNSQTSDVLSWDGFAELSSKSIMPAYALGGMQPNDIPACVQSGGQGIAAIRSFWNAGFKKYSRQV